MKKLLRWIDQGRYWNCDKNYSESINATCYFQMLTTVWVY